MDLRQVEADISNNIYELVNVEGRSECWKSFKGLKRKDNGEELFGVACCATCKRCMLYKTKDVTGKTKTYGTKNLIDHLSHCSPNSFNRNQHSVLATLKQTKSAVTPVYVEKVRHSQVLFTAGAHLPYKIMDNEQFRSYSQTLIEIGAKFGNVDVNNLLYGRKTICSETFKLMCKVKANIKENIKKPLLKKNVAFAIDLWTDPNLQRSYMDLTFFWIKEAECCWCLHHGMYACELFSLTPTSEDIQEKLYEHLLSVGCDTDDIAVTTDKESNIFAAMTQKTQIDCSCHRLHVSVDAAWESCKIKAETLSELDEAARGLVKYVKLASNVQSENGTTLKQGGTSTPWRSLMNMLISILCNLDDESTLRRVLRTLGKDHLLNSISLELLKAVVEFLEPLGSVYDILEYAYLPTLQNVIPAYYLLRLNWEKNNAGDLPEICTMKAEFMDSLNEKLWPSLTLLHWSATFLDPSLKSFNFIPNDWDRTEMQNQARESVVDYAKAVVDECNSSNNDVFTGSGMKCKSTADSETPLSSFLAKKAKLDPFQAFRNNTDQPTQNGADGEWEALKYTYEDVRAEVARYEAVTGNIAACCEVCDKSTATGTTAIFDPLKWWGFNSLQYPILSTVAKRILVIPASSSESERTFLCVGRIARKDRARLKPSSIEAQVLVSEAIKKKQMKLI